MDYLNCKKIVFNDLGNRQISCSYEGFIYQKCDLVRCFPLSYKSNYIAVCSDGMEIGIIYSIEDLDDISKRIVIDYLENKYLIPRIIKINSKKYTKRSFLFNCITDKGNVVFNIQDIVNNIFVSNDDLYLKDSNENYYCIENYKNKNDKNIKFIKGLI